MSNLDKVKKQRIAARGWITRAMNNLEAVLKQDPADKVDYEEAMSEFDKRLKILDDVQSKVESELPEEEIEADVEQAGAIRDKAKQCLKKVMRAFVKLFPVQLDSDSIYQGTSNVQGVKLPKLELPKFSGVVTEWPTFWEKFEAIVDESDIPTVSKFTYLQSLLQGEAKDAVAGLSLTTENYKTACKLLVDRFGKKEVIIFAHIQALLSVTVSSVGTKSQNLRKLQDELLTHVRSLEALEVEGKTYGLFLTPLLLSRLPPDIRLEWSRGEVGHESDLEWLLTFLTKEIESRERAEVFKGVTASNTPTSKPPIKAYPERRKVYQGTASALKTTSDVQSACGFCKKGHPPEKCREVMHLTIKEKQDRIKEARLCFRCLQLGHMARGCNARCSHCSGKHHALCCFDRLGERKKPPDGELSETSSQSNHDNGINSETSHAGVLSSAAFQCSRKCTMLQTAKVYVFSERGRREATLLIDGGSDRSYITTDFVNKVGLTSKATVNLAYAAFGGGKSTRQNRNLHKINLKGVFKGHELQSLLVVEVPIICTPLQRAKIPRDAFKPFDDLGLADRYECNPTAIDIVVGMDHYWDIVRPAYVHSPSGLVAQDTVFGWVISGAFQGVQPQIAHQLVCMEDIPDSFLRNFWELESIGISPKSEENDDDSHILNQFNKSITFNEGRYEVSLPWKANKPRLIANEKEATLRLKSLSRRLDKDHQLQTTYNSTLEEMEQNDVIEEVPGAELKSFFPVFYLPHHPVVRECSTSTKVRPVFDASATGPNQVSLNDCLEAGPSLVPNLVCIIMRFRRWVYAISADITKAFLQIKLRREDQDVHRFLWSHNGNIRVMRFLRVTFGVKSSPFLLNATIRHHLSSVRQSHVVQELTDNLYVDDWLSGADSETKASDMFLEARSLMLYAGMSLAKWSTNSEILANKVYSELDSKHLEAGSLKILGIKWTPNTDMFSYEGITLPENVVATKRVVLSFIARLFDPVGFLSPYVLIIKILFQELWQLGLDWDEEIPQTLGERFSKWLSGIEMLRQWDIPRRYSTCPWTSIKGLELHCFGDASTKGYGAVVYIRIPQVDGTFVASLAIARAKVAPLKRVTLPRLELLGSLMSARLLRFALEALQLPSNTPYKCWTDSTVSLAWIKGNPNNWKPFVANRVIEIQSLTDPAVWFHCPGKDNPADLTTCGLYAQELVKSDMWLRGPFWLSQPVDCFPKLGHSQLPDTLSEEVVTGDVVSLHTASQEGLLMLFNKWGSLTKTWRILAWVCRFVKNCGSPTVVEGESDLTQNELLEARLKLYRLTQLHYFPAEYAALQEGRPLLKNSPLCKLTPFIGSDGLLRVKGRLQNSNLSYESKHPIILPRGHLSDILVHFQHKLLKHAGVDTMVSSLRNVYWIIGLRRLAKQVKRECVYCQFQDAKGCNAPAAPLPDLRVSQAPPFAVTGVDFAGPLFCSDVPKKKYYVLLFTCAVVRAIHLEVTDSLSTADFLLALRRFCSRRGMPSIIYSDNAGTFKAAESQLVKLFGPNTPQWKYIMPKSPWWGGWWERLIRSVKSALRKTLGKLTVNKTELETTLIEIEACVNSRPLTFLGDEVDSMQPLTPSHFLIGRSAGFQPENHVSDLWLMHQKLAAL